MTISIIIPIFNEEKTISVLLDKVLAIQPFHIQKEIIVVDDASTDASHQILMNYQSKIKYCKNETNHGKGYSIRKGIKEAKGDVIIIQDADLEYDPKDYEKLLLPVIEKKAQVVYGSRFTGPHNNLFFTHYLANKFITFLIDLFFNTTLSDVEVGYKVFTKNVLDKITLHESRFGFEIEVTAKILKTGEKIYEVPITYTGRDYSEGKKIGFMDGVNALLATFKYRFFD